jgi:hypothetical protein
MASRVEIKPRHSSTILGIIGALVCLFALSMYLFIRMSCTESKCVCANRLFLKTLRPLLLQNSTNLIF